MPPQNRTQKGQVQEMLINLIFNSNYVIKKEEKQIESKYMERKRLSYRDKLWYVKEEVKDLERLLEQARERLNEEYDRVGGRSVWEWAWYMLGYYV